MKNLITKMNNVEVYEENNNFYFKFLTNNEEIIIDRLDLFKLIYAVSQGKDKFIKEAVRCGFTVKKMTKSN